MAIRPLSHDFSPFEQLGFDDEPVGVKFEYLLPKTILRLSEPMAMCEMVREAQTRDTPFYMDESNEDCMGRGAMGMMPDDPSWAEAGLIGERMGIFSDAGANMRFMRHYTTFSRGAVRYVVFARLSALEFEPDLLIFSGPMSQCEVILRAMAYSTGEMFESKATPVFQCSWLYSYPQLTGKVNYLVMGTGHGTTARETYEPGSILVSVPSPWFPIILENLGRMERVPHAWEIGRKAWLKEEGAIYENLIHDSGARH